MKFRDIATTSQGVEIRYTFLSLKGYYEKGRILAANEKSAWMQYCAVCRDFIITRMELDNIDMSRWKYDKDGNPTFAADTFAGWVLSNRFQVYRKLRHPVDIIRSANSIQETLKHLNTL